MKYDTIVIGAGVSGLSAAILLAQNGRKVALLEKYHAIAPTIRGFFRGDVYFDTGFHYAGMLGPDEPLTRLCERLGILSHIKVGEDKKTVGDCFYCTDPEFKFDFKMKLQNLAQELTESFPEEEEAITRFLQDIKYFLDTINEDLFRVVMDPTSIFQNAHLSLTQYLRENFKSPELQTLLSLHALLYGSIPEETSLLYHSMVVGAYYDRSRQVVDGGYAITQAFENELQKYDVDIYTNCTVDQIFINDDRTLKAIGLEGGEVVGCDNCVFTGHPRMLIDMLPEGSLRPIYHSRLQGLEDTSSAVVIYCVSEKANLDNNFHNMILAHKLFPEMYDLEGGFEDRFMFISHSLSDGHVGGTSIICPCRFEDVGQWGSSKTGQRPLAYCQWKERVADTIVGVVKQYYNDALGDLRIIDVASPLTFRDYMNAPSGCLYGAKHKITDMPFMSRTRIKGLYLSGQAIVSAGLMGAMLSGFLSAAAITGEDYRETMQ
ncbi:MAG: phytoene desaturase family protein [Planctomycetota bacterium]|jgi:all-trans-retinol 13,14-reductase